MKIYVFFFFFFYFSIGGCLRHMRCTIRPWAARWFQRLLTDKPSSSVFLQCFHRIQPFCSYVGQGDDAADMVKHPVCWRQVWLSRTRAFWAPERDLLVVHWLKMVQTSVVSITLDTLRFECTVLQVTSINMERCIWVYEVFAKLQLWSLVVTASKAKQYLLLSVWCWPALFVAAAEVVNSSVSSPNTLTSWHVDLHRILFARL